MAIILRRQPVKLPTPEDVLSDQFIGTYGRPAGLWTPSTWKPQTGAWDFSGKGNNGTLTGGVTVVPGGFGVLGQAWHTDGINGYLFSALSGTTGTEFTISVTFRLNATSGLTGLFQWASALTAGAPFLLIQQNSGNLRIYVDGNYRETSQTLIAGAWYTVTVTASGGTTWKFYLNGAPLSTYVGGMALQANATGIYLGNGFAGYTDALFANLSIWKGVALSAAQVSSLYNALKYGVP